MYQWNAEKGFRLCPDQPETDSVFVSSEIHAALMASQSEGKQIVADNDGNPIAVSPTLTLDEQKQQAAQQVKIMTESAIEPHVAKYTQSERDSWPEQATMARAYSDGSASEEQTALLTGMATTRGFADAGVMAERVLTKAAQFTALTLTVVSYKNKAIESIEAASSSEDIAATISTFEQNLTAMGGSDE